MDNDTVNIKKSDIDALLRISDGHAALLYLYLLRNGWNLEKNSAASKIGIYPNELAIAYGKLKDKGLVPDISGEITQRPDIPPEYSQQEVAESAGSDPAFKYLVGETQRRTGKLLSASDMTILFGIYDYLGFSAEIISLLLSYCVSEAEYKYGQGKVPTMRQIEKTAYIWARNGVDTEEDALAYVKKANENRTARMKAAKLLQITDRALSATEIKYLDEWIALGFGPEEIYKAYDITVIKTGGLKWQYMNSILRNWHEKGSLTLKQIEAGETKGTVSRTAVKSAQSGSAPGSSFIGEHEKNAVQWLKSKRKPL